MEWRACGRKIEISRVLIMGILNITPDSFSDGGMYSSPDDALSGAHRLLDEGADILDIGGESTRPGSVGVDAETEIARVTPVIEQLSRTRPGALLSIDTSKPEVASAALSAGACIVNDITAGGDPGMRSVLTLSDCGVIIMHMQGAPRTMQENPVYEDVVAEVGEYLLEKMCALESAGVACERIALDPGIGFGKLLEHNVALLKGIPALARLGRPICIGASRKSMLGQITGKPVGKRMAASVAGAVFAAQMGANIVRVHDVAETIDALKVYFALAGSRGEWKRE